MALSHKIIVPSNSVLIRLVCLLLLLASAAPTQAIEVLLSGTRLQGCRTFPYGVPLLEWVVPRAVEIGSTVYAIASNESGQVYGLVDDDTEAVTDVPYRVVRFTPSGERVFFAGGLGHAGALTVADDGRVYVLADYSFGKRIDRYSASGKWEAFYTLLAAHMDLLDVASDGCTLFYRLGTGIERINGCTGQQLLPFADIPNVQDLEAQPDGQVLVATGSAVLLYDAAGNLVRTVAAAEPGRTIDQASLHDGVLWMTSNDACSDGALLRVSFENGTVLSRHALTHMTTTSGMVVTGSWPARRRASRH